jgi:aspartate kinase
VSVSVTVDDRRHLPAVVGVLSEFAEVSCEHDLAIGCVVGEGLQQEPALVGRVFQAVGDVPVKLLSQAASRRNITFVIRETDVPLVLGRLHDHFFTPEPTGARA